MKAVADTSVILNLCLLGRQEILPALFSSIVCPHEVKKEFDRLVKVDPRFEGLLFPDYIRLHHVNVTPSILDTPRLHVGERAALALALEMQLPLILMDERAGRQFAKQLGLRSLGLLGVLIEARRKGLLTLLGPLLDRLETDARFWMSETLKQEVLALVGER